MRYKYIFWDWNGTLIDDVQNALSCVNEMLEEMGRKSITLREYYSYIETPIVGFYRRLLAPEEPDFEKISKDFHTNYEKNLPETYLASGAKDVLSSLKERGAKHYIITASHTDEATSLTKRFGIGEYFEEILGADDNYAESKTQRAIDFFNKKGIPQGDALFVGDTLHDLEVANALGIDCVLVSYGHQGKKALFESGCFVVDTLKEVENIILDDRRIDLHCHSTRSDGTLTPTELVKHAKDLGLSAIALTDHDSVNGIKEALEAAEKLRFLLIPGIEFSVAADTELHIIGLFLDPENDVLLKTIEGLVSSRRRRMEDICEKLSALSLPVSYEEARLEAGGDFVGRAHIARLMIKKGYVSSVKEAFSKYIGIGRPAYSEKKELTVKSAIEAISAAGGCSFLAHLNQTGYSDEKLFSVLSQMKEYGLTGIEGYYPEYTKEQTAAYRTMAGKLGLVFSGGSDFHGSIKPAIELGSGFGSLNIPYFVLENIKRHRDTLYK